MNPKELTLIYVWDAYCGWCYGFSKSLQAFHENHPELALTVLSGGLFVNNKKLPIASFPHIPEANKRISQLTGAEFGAPYQRLLEEGTFVMDSEAAAKGLSALRFFAPERSYYLASSIQHAFYYEGKSLSDPATYREIAIANNLDPEAVLARFGDVASTKDAHADFAKVQQLGVQGYPTLLLQKGDELIGLGGGVMTAEKIENRLRSVIS
ncbi:DSBA-like thioredoxin domain protein [Bhargavaea cecembensis DSE10]|uniref:DSBA-like thioredoxin domain protein n=1 Tax=Bhargavaea cecembensis DSE10 TaxID=1235279 RepID=M7NJA7_9BACL|nr:DsbA family protein [Bhargavaea cecembensis]EMR07302.1 DSBA-like thioredoxin domain protein [Bhargavaea cecembensis DSE10]